MTFKSVLFSLCLLLNPLFMAGCGGGSDPEPVVVTPASDVPVTLSTEVKARTYSLEKENSIVFVFDEATQQAMLTAAKVTTIDSIGVRGSFNGWKNTGLNLTKSASDAGVWYLEKSLADVNVPGNSGQPEFKFVVKGTVNGTAAATAWIDVGDVTPAGYFFSGNHIVVFQGDNLDTIIANKALADTVKTLANFDLTTDAGKAELSNFRLVPGTSKLYRAYHPFKKSRPTMETEAPRIALVNELMEAKSVQSVITLSTLETPDVTQSETISPWMQAIMGNGDNLVLDVSYNQVYFESDSAAFGLMIKDVVTFIVDPQHAAPFMVHCRLGTDRTGVTTATLAALVGTSWTSISGDYQLSNNMGMQEFRDYKILQYSFERMLQIPRGTIGSVNLQQKMRAYFIDNGYLTQEQIDALAAKIV